MLHLLGDWRELRLIRVTAPAGFGKTTLAATWLRQMGDGTIIAWLSLDAEDDVEAVLLQHIEESLQPALPELAAAWTLESAGRLTFVQTLRLLCRAVVDAGRDFILVLDDCHVLCAAGSVGMLQQLLDMAPPNLHLVLLSRETVPLNVARMRLQGTLLDIVAADLSLDHEEFDIFVRGSALAGLSADQLVKIEQRAAGWIAGLQMLLLTRHAREALPDEALPDEAWQAGIVAEFMEQEVFRYMDPVVRAFLIDTALLPWLAAEPAVVVTGLDEAHCTRLLYAAADTNAFVTPFASPSKFTCRCHPLFREFLLRKLQDERSPAQLRALRLRTAAWLGAHDEIDAALTLLQPIGAWDEAAAIVAAASRPAILRMDLASLQRWLARLPADVVDRTPQLAVDAAWLMFLSDGADLKVPVARAYQALAGAEPGADVDEWRTELGVLQVFCELTDGNFSAVRATIARTTQIAHAAVGLGAGYLYLVSSYEPADPSDFDQRIQLLIRGEQIFQAIGFDYGCIEAAVAKGLTRRRYADMKSTLASIQYAISVVHRSGWEHSLYSFDCHIACGEVLYEMNQLDAARAELKLAVAANQYSASADATAYLARLMLELCDWANADVLALPEDDDVWANIVGTTNPIIVANVGWIRIRRDLCAGRLERCWQTVENMGVFPANLTADMPEMTWISVLTGALADGQQLALLDVLLADFRRRLEAAHNNWMLLRVRVMQVVHRLFIDDLAGAEAELETLLPHIEQSGMLRIVLDWPQLELLLARSQSPFAQRLSGMFSYGAPAGPPFGLSAHEFQVLRGIATNLSTAEIARKMVIETSTVRKHLVRVFRKMGVHSRDEAVQVARDAGVA